MSSVDQAENIGFQESDDFEEFLATDSNTTTVISGH